MQHREMLLTRLEERENECLSQRSQLRASQRTQHRLELYLYQARAEIARCEKEALLKQRELDEERVSRKAYEEQLADTHTQVMQYATEIATLSTKEQLLQARTAQLEHEIRALQQLLADNKEHAVSQSINIRHLAQKLADVEAERDASTHQQKSRQPPDADIVRVLADMQRENASLVSEKHDLELQLSNANEINRHEASLLHSSQLCVAKLERTVRERTKHERGDSLADDLATASWHVDMPRPADSHVNERDADFEFFSLTLLCAKIHFGRKLDSLVGVSVQDMWQLAKSQHTPFHRYYAWIEEQMSQAYVQGVKPAHTQVNKSVCHE